MRSILENKLLMLPTLFCILLCSYGDFFAEKIITSTPLSTWLQDNKLSIAYSGSDLSILPAVAVIAFVFSASSLLSLLLEMVYDLYDTISHVAEKPVEKVNSTSRNEVLEQETHPQEKNKKDDTENEK